MLHGMWDLPRRGLEPVSPALAGGFLTTAPPGKSHSKVFTNAVGLLYPPERIAPPPRLHAHPGSLGPAKGT